MVKRYFQIILMALFCIGAFGFKSIGESYKYDARIEVTMRMIGHELLLSSNDSTSLILPIEKDANQYKIQFGSSFQFEPEQLVAIIDKVVNETKIAERYLVEVNDCNTGKVVYSYEKGNSVYSSIVPCSSRIQPEGSYFILFTVLEPALPIVVSYSEIPTQTQAILSGSNQPINFTIVLLIFSLALLTGVFVFIRLRGRIPGIHPNVISMGEYKFDKRNMELLHENNKTELTGKEAELLYLLYNSANSIIDRAIILKVVWGDEGDYVGRTLDVYISKLRKKLEADANLKIVNIRGIGYKLIMNV